MADKDSILKKLLLILFGGVIIAEEKLQEGVKLLMEKGRLSEAEARQYLLCLRRDAEDKAKARLNALFQKGVAATQPKQPDESKKD